VKGLRKGISTDSPETPTGNPRTSAPKKGQERGINSRLGGAHSLAEGTKDLCFLVGEADFYINL
jgi:hypothetical protein